MGWVIYYTLLLVAFISSTAYSAAHPGTLPLFFRVLSGAIPILTALAQALAKVNFRFYLFTQRIWVWLHPSTSANWRFGLRLDGSVGVQAIDRLKSLMETDLKVWSPRIVSAREGELRLIIDRTIHLTITYEYETDSNDGQDHLLIRSDELEITYASARRKIDTCIVPLMTSLLRHFPADNSSTMLDVFFSSRNPFFAFFVAHLRAEQVNRFNLVFRPEGITRNAADKVTVTQNSISINAQSPNAFASLSKAFLLLTEDAAAFQAL